MTVKELREKTGMSQNQFAEYLEIPAATIRNWEQGRRTPPDYVITLISKVIEGDKNGD